MRNRRLQLELTINEAAKGASITPRQWIRLEQGGTTQPWVSTAGNIADTLRVSLDWLVGRTNRPDMNP